MLSILSHAPLYIGNAMTEQPKESPSTEAAVLKLKREGLHTTDHGEH